MQDFEIQDLLAAAGYSFNTISGRYDIVNAAEDDEVADQTSEDIADILEIPLDDLQRWEIEQVQAERTAD
jgi:hypothetical protein